MTRQPPPPREGSAAGDVQQLASARADLGGMSVLTVVGDEHRFVDEVVEAGATEIREVCHLRSRPVLTVAAARTLAERDGAACWGHLLAGVEDPDARALAVGFDPDGPLSANDLLFLAETRSHVDGPPLVGLFFTPPPSLHEVLASIRFALLGHRSIAPVLLVPAGNLDSFAADFTEAVKEQGINILTRGYGIHTRSMAEVAGIVENEALTLGTPETSGDCPAIAVIEAVATGVRETAPSKRAQVIRHLQSCDQCSQVSWHLASHVQMLAGRVTAKA